MASVSLPASTSSPRSSPRPSSTSSLTPPSSLSFLPLRQTPRYPSSASLLPTLSTSASPSLSNPLSSAPHRSHALPLAAPSQRSAGGKWRHRLLAMHLPRHPGRSDSPLRPAPSRRRRTPARARRGRLASSPWRPSTSGPPSQRTREPVIQRLMETLSTESILSKRYGILSPSEASFALSATIANGVAEGPFLVFMDVALSITAFPVLAIASSPPPAGGSPSPTPPPSKPSPSSPKPSTPLQPPLLPGPPPLPSAPPRSSSFLSLAGLPSRCYSSTSPTPSTAVPPRLPSLSSTSSTLTLLLPATMSRSPSLRTSSCPTSFPVLHWFADQRARIRSSPHPKTSPPSDLRPTPPPCLPVPPDFLMSDKVPPRIHPQLSKALSIISSPDFSQAWPSLLPELVSNLRSAADYSTVHGLLRLPQDHFPRLHLAPLYIPPVVQSFFPLNGVLGCDGHSMPLLAVQVTELADGGIFVSCSLNHAVADGTSFWHFFSSL